MAVSIRPIAPVAHLPLVLGVLRKLEVAQLIDSLIPPNPAQVLSNGRGVEALAYSTEFCHLIRRKAATQSTAKLPLIPQESCH
jgi:hypothetical protein